MKRTIYRVQWNKKHCMWVVMLRRVPIGGAGTQVEAVRIAVTWARSDLLAGRLAQVVLHGKERIRWERTYGKDPRRSKG